jgi:hypothetical protein
MLSLSLTTAFCMQTVDGKRREPNSMFLQARPSRSLALTLSLSRSLDLALAPLPSLSLSPLLSLSLDLAAPTHQVIVPVGSVVDFSFSSHAQHAAGDRLGAALSGEALSARMVQHFEMFDHTFDQRFKLESVPCHDAPATAKAPAVPACREATYTPEAREFGKVSPYSSARSRRNGRRKTNAAAGAPTAHRTCPFVRVTQSFGRRSRSASSSGGWRISRGRGSVPLPPLLPIPVRIPLPYRPATSQVPRRPAILQHVDGAAGGCVLQVPAPAGRSCAAARF